MGNQVSCLHLPDVQLFHPGTLGTRNGLFRFVLKPESLRDIIGIHWVINSACTALASREAATKRGEQRMLMDTSMIM